MATPADQRILDLLDTWLSSLELHSKYTALDDESYWKMQAWVPHQRPTRWIVDLAMQKTRALRDLVQERVDKGDAKFAEGLESMAFLANLVGLQNIERFIPRADPSVVGTSAEELTGTLKMPAFSAELVREPPPAATRNVARGERKKAQKPSNRAKTAPKAAAPAGTNDAPSVTETTPGDEPAVAQEMSAAQRAEAARSQVVADAARLLQWGRSWHELAELISRMAGRPPPPEVRRILQENKAAIDDKAGLT